ncbi:MAG: hypothetical protein ACFFD2_14785 [Promethearchaeota archaeon]
MIKSKIPQSVQDILDVFIRFNFTRLQYKTLANRLGLKVDTLIQRISRNKEYFEVDDSSRPSRISIKKGLKEVYFYRDKNKCQLCQKVINPERLILKFRNPYQEDKYDWQNVLSVCDECKNNEIIKKVKRIEQPGVIEYKEVSIKLTSKRDLKTDSYVYYYEFDEYDGMGEFPLLDEDGNIASKTVADILNYFSAEGWEVIHIDRILEEEYALEEYQVIFKRKREEGKISGEIN